MAAIKKNYKFSHKIFAALRKGTEIGFATRKTNYALRSLINWRHSLIKCTNLVASRAFHR